MKKILTITLLALFAVSASHAQYKVDKGDNRVLVTGKDGEQIVKISPDSHKKDRFSVEILGMQIQFKGDEYNYTGDAPVITKPRYNRGHIAFFEVGFNGIGDVDYYMYADPADHGFVKTGYRWQNFQIAGTLAKFSMDLDRWGSTSFATAIQISIDDYVFDNNISLQKEGGMMIPVRSATPYKKSKLFTYSVRIPLMIETNFPKGFFMSWGVYFSMVANSNTKVKSPVERVYEPYINPLQAGIAAKVGWRDIYFYVYSSATNLFKDGMGPMFKYATMGIGIDF